MADRPSDQRVSDADRERVVGELADHAAVGRLDLVELGERTKKAYTARTVGELAAATRDLPAPRPSPRVVRLPARLRLYTAAWAVAVAVDAAVLEATTDEGVGLIVGDGEGVVGPSDEIATLFFWVLAGGAGALAVWAAVVLAVRAVYRPGEPPRLARSRGVSSST